MTAAVGLLFAKSISMVTLILTVPLALHRLGPEQFGVWMTLTSLATLLSTADFGVGNGLMTELAKYSSGTEKDKLSSIVSNGLATLICLAVVMILAFLLAYPWIDPNYIFGDLAAESHTQAKLAMLIFFIASFASIPAMLGQRMMIGLQLGWWSGIWAGIGSVTALGMLLVAVAFEADLAGMIFAFVGSPVIVLIIATYWSFRKNSEIKIHIKFLDKCEIWRIAKQGSRFFVLTLIYAASFTTDNVIIARTMGAHAVAIYSITDRLFQIIAVALTMISAPLWPAYADAFARKRYGWIIGTFRRSIALNIALGGVGAAALIGASQWIFPLWLGSAITPPFALMIWIAVRRLIEAVYTACNNMMNALDIITIQLAFGILMALSALLCRFIFVSLFGINGVPIAVIVSVASFGFIPSIIALRRLHVISSVGE